MTVTQEEHADRKKTDPRYRPRVESVTLLPDPPKAERTYTIVSVDDHLMEPRDAFVGRVPAKFADRAPRVVVDGTGHEWWQFDGKVIAYVGLDATAGRPLIESGDPKSFDEMRRGTWDIHARIADMDLDGVYASLNFPSMLTGFGGGRIQTSTGDLELSLATIRAWNDWHLADWAGPYPDRIIPCQIPWLHDPVVGAEEIRRNAARGFRAVSFPEAPEKLGFPSANSRVWDPIMAACAETQTVLCLHTGSGGALPATSADASPEISSLLFGLFAMYTAVDWVYSLIPARFPDLKICLSEGGIGWVAGLLDRLEHSFVRSKEVYRTWDDFDLTPAETFQRNFWLCSVDDPSSFVQIDRIGSDRVMVEADYPHMDSSWPNTQAHVHNQVKGLSPEVIRKVTWQTASKLFRHPVPVDIQNDPKAF